MKFYSIMMLTLGWAAVSFAAPENLALNKPYTLSPAPNYQLCTDPGDQTQLTDGVYSEGYFWIQKGTVGWSSVAPVQCIIDLGQVLPICGASWSTAAGVAGVNWPESILILTSEDRKSWTFLGDLCELEVIEKNPPIGQYATFRYATERMQGRGRYVCILAAARPYCFVDEIEIWRGPEALLSGELPGERTDDPKRFYEESCVRLGVATRLRSDLKSILAQADAMGFSGALADSKKTVTLLQQEIPEAAENVPDDFQAVLPYGKLHRHILALNAPVLRAAGVLQPMVWQSNRWDPLTLSAIPARGSGVDSVTLDLMRGEVRGESFNITNPNDSELDLKLSVDEMPAGLNLELREVLFTDTQSRQPVAAALRPLAADAQGSYPLRVPAGCTRQVWLASNRPDAPARTYTGIIKITADDAAFNKSLALRVRIRNLNFPSQPSLHVGGWDYVQGDANYYRAPGNIDANLALMRSMYVDSPWATPAVFPKGRNSTQRDNS